MLANLTLTKFGFCHKFDNIRNVNQVIRRTNPTEIKKRFFHLINLFIFLSCYHPTVADYLLTQMIKPIFCISISFQMGHQLQKGFRNIVPSEPFIGKNVKIQVFYSGKTPTKTSVCLRAEVYGCEIPQGKTFCLSNFNGEELCDFLLPW